MRRGSERLVHDLSLALAERGHGVTLITSHEGPRTVSTEDGARVVRVRRMRPRPPLDPYEDHLDSVPAMLWELRRGVYDVAHAFTPAYGWAALQARERWGGPPVVFSFHGMPERRYLVGRRYRLEMLRAIVDEASAITVLSGAAASAFNRYLLREPQVLPGGVLTERFATDGDRDAAPTLLCAASLGDARKRPELLFSAFEGLRRSEPRAKLWLVRPRDPFMSRSPVPALPAGAEWIDGDRIEDLARAYAHAWGSVLPAVGEAFGLVLIESLAAGTPVVAARTGGCPEIVDDDSIGRLFEPDDPGALAEAMGEALSLAQRDGTREACRKRAEAYDWRRVVESYEYVYDSVVPSVT